MMLIKIRHKAIPKLYLHLILVGLLALAVVCLAYQIRTPMRIAIGDDVLKDIQGFNFVQTGEGHTYRWTDKDAFVSFASVGKTSPTLVSVVAYAWRDETQVYSATVTLNGHPIGVIDRANWRNWRFSVSDPAIQSAEDWVIGFHSVGFALEEGGAAQDNSNIRGIAIESVEIVPQANTTSLTWVDRVTLPSLAQLGFVVLFVLACYLATDWLGLGERWRLVLSVALIAFFGLGIAFFRQIVVQRELILALAVGVFALTKIVRDRFTLSRDTQSKSRWGLWIIPASVMLVAFILRLHAIPLFFVEADDGLYMQVAESYYQAIRSADWGALVAYDNIIEHPRFFVVLFALGMLVRDFLAIPIDNIVTMRVVAAFFGTLQAGMLAVLNPLAGWFLAIQTTEIKFTSMAYLEALPAFAAAAAVIGYEKFRRTSNRTWLWLSALALGATGASKFIYAVAGFAIAPFLLWEQRRQLKNIFLYGLITALAFFVFDPYLWPDPVGRLQGMFSFHASFSTREYVKELNRPWWYNWVILAEPARIYRQSFEYQPPFVMVWDKGIFLLGILGLPSLFRQSRLYILWLITGLIFIALWEAKWEQYAMLIATPLCLSAGYLISDSITWLTPKFSQILGGKHFENISPVSNT
jgi:hypothetical protein